MTRNPDDGRPSDWNPVEAEELDGAQPIAVSEMTADEVEPLLADDPLEDHAAEVVSADPGSALTTPTEIKAAVEALLFASPEPLTVKRICQTLGDVDNKDVRKALLDLQIEYATQGRGMQVLEVAGGYQMATQEKFAEFVLRLSSKKKPPALSPATLETLAIIAYRQPVIRAEVESVRGVESSGTIRNLLDLGFIEITGKKEVIGRPPLYGTTEKFLKAFGLRKIAELPSIRGLRERFGAEDNTPNRDALADQGQAVSIENQTSAQSGENLPQPLIEPKSDETTPSEDVDGEWLGEKPLNEGSNATQS